LEGVAEGELGAKNLAECWKRMVQALGGRGERGERHAGEELELLVGEISQAKQPCISVPHGGRTGAGLKGSRLCQGWQAWDEALQ